MKVHLFFPSSLRFFEAVPKKFEIVEEDKNMCKVCFERPVQITLVPCGHLCLCVDCSGLLTAMEHKCPICRNNIDSVIKTFIV